MSKRFLTTLVIPILAVLALAAPEATVSGQAAAQPSSGFGQTDKSPQINSDQIVLYDNYLLPFFNEITYTGLEHQVSWGYSNNTIDKWGKVNIPQSFLR